MQYQGVAEHAGNGGIGLAEHRYIYFIAFSVDGLVLNWEQQNHFSPINSAEAVVAPIE